MTDCRCGSQAGARAWIFSPDHVIADQMSPAHVAIVRDARGHGLMEVTLTSIDMSSVDLAIISPPASRM
ncbi:hypothetical protein [Mesorhizobium delmotii]|uniref:hypothetical protein n=1 Tax=Mesorhizobium delmotii TaxID=1631247 RepID=UPI001403B4C4|nr:hypothetical protein [Mesorhizobium delmotii]